MRQFVTSLLLFGIFLLVGWELLFRTLIPASQMPAGFQYLEEGVMALDPAVAQEGKHTLGRLGRPAYRWGINNDGFNSTIAYLPSAEQHANCIALIGNSYSQGLYSDVGHDLAGSLQQNLSNGSLVYNLASSGMPLSQCPVVAKFAMDRYQPDIIVIQAGSSSLIRCLRSNGQVRFCRQYTFQNGSITPLPPSTFTINSRNRLLRKSAFIRYLFYNANLNFGGAGDVVEAQRQFQDEPGELNGIPNDKYEQVLDRIMKDIAQAAPGVPVLIVFDADRNAIYKSPEKPRPLDESTLVKEACTRNNVNFQDLTDIFYSDYQAHGIAFNFKENYHWNPYGVSLVSREIAKKINSLGLLPPSHTASQESITGS